MRILVTGGAGFIGSHLCRYLVKSGAEVRVLDLLIPDEPCAGVEYIQGDARNRHELLNAVRGVDVVYHLAALVSVSLCQKFPVDSYQTNVMATANLLDAVAQEMEKTQKKIKVIFTSTSAVYGETLDRRPIPESATSKAALISFYAAQKLASEQMLALYGQSHGVATLVFRLFNVYGPGQNLSSPYAGVISIFTKALCRGKKIELRGGGQQVRDFVSVHDVARALGDAASLPASEFDGSVINLGTEQPTYIHELARTIAELADRGPMLADVTERSPSDILFSLAETSQAKAKLRWYPRISLEAGLRELVSLELARLPLRTTESPNYVAPQIQY